MSKDIGQAVDEVSHTTILSGHSFVGAKALGTSALIAAHFFV